MATIRVLLVDDDILYAGLLRRYLVHGVCDSELTHAVSLAEAIVALKGSTFDIVLLDLSLPDSFGVDGIHRLQEHSGAVPLVVLTGHEDAQQAYLARSAGALDYLSKSDVEPKLLARSLQGALERKHADQLSHEQSRLVTAVLGGLGTDPFRGALDLALVAAR